MSGTAPFYIVVAEKKGFPPVEQQSLAHCMENMWLKATALGLGFQIVSATAQMADNPKFCRILGLESGKWALMGCAVGYPAKSVSFDQAIGRGSHHVALSKTGGYRELNADVLHQHAHDSRKFPQNQSTYRN